MIFDIKRPRGENPAIIMLHAKILHRRSNFLDLDDATLGDHRLVLKLPLIFAILCTDFLYAALCPRTAQSSGKSPVTFPTWSSLASSWEAHQNVSFCQILPAPEISPPI